MNLVTGATGHIGNVLVRELLERGERVRTLVRRSKRPVALEGLDVELVQGDILEPGSLEAAMKEVEVVYHLAAKINLSAGADPETERINLEGTRNILEAMQKTQGRRLVYASTIYALKKPTNGSPIDERQPFEAEHSKGTYDASKAKASLEVLNAVARGLDAVIVCPTAVTGPYDYQESEAGRAIRLYMRPGVKFLVEGAYDFVDVRDVAEGFILAATKGRSGETYILGGDRMTVGEVAATVWAATGFWHPHLKVPLTLAYFVAGLMSFYHDLTGARPLFTRYSLDAICSNSRISHAKASRELGFSPRPAREAIVDSVRWFQARMKGEAFAEIEREAAT